MAGHCCPAKLADFVSAQEGNGPDFGLRRPGREAERLNHRQGDHFTAALLGKRDIGMAVMHRCKMGNRLSRFAARHGRVESGDNEARARSLRNTGK
jgi:hypothetical protein